MGPSQVAKSNTGFRERITELGLLYVVGIQSSMSVWRPGQAPLPKPKWKGIGLPTKLLRRDGKSEARFAALRLRLA